MPVLSPIKVFSMKKWILVTMCLTSLILFLYYEPLEDKHRYRQTIYSSLLSVIVNATPSSITSSNINVRRNLNVANIAESKEAVVYEPASVHLFNKTISTVNKKDKETKQVGGETLNETTLKRKQESTGTVLSSNYSSLESVNDYTLNNVSLCSNATRLLVVVQTAPDNSKSRKAIRQTWAADRPPNVALAFLIGRINFTANKITTSQLQEKLTKEHEKYGDIIQDKSFVDSYLNLTLKSIAMLKWASEFCETTNALLKTDDDMWININRVLELVAYASEGLYGVLFKGAKPYRNPKSKWYVPYSQYTGSQYPSYLSGTAYLIINKAVIPRPNLFSSQVKNVIKRLYNATFKVKHISMEDVYITGLVAHNASVPRRNPLGFNYTKVNYTKLSVCPYTKLISSHHISDDEKYQIHRLLKNKSLTQKCEKHRKKYMNFLLSVNQML